MKFILLLLFIFSFSASSQVRLADSQYLVKSSALKNPGFEQGYGGWVITGTCLKSLTANVPYLSLSLQLICSGDDFSIKQETTDLVGLDSQLYLDAKVQATASGVIVRSLEDGSEQTAITLPIYSKATPVSIPTTIGATSNGVEIYATSYTGTIIIDDLALVVDDRRFQVPVVSKGTPYTPSITGLVGATAEKIFWKQNGNTIDIYGTLTAGTIDASVFSISIPDGFTIDASQLSIKESANDVGRFTKVAANTSAFSTSIDGPFIAFTDTSVSSTLVYAARDSVTAGFKKNNGNDLFENGSRISVNIKGIPVNELSATPASIVKEKADLVEVFAYRSGSVQTLPDATSVTVVYNTEKKDNYGAYDTSTGIFTAPLTSCYYVVSKSTLVAYGAVSSFNSFLRTDGGDVLDERYVQTTTTPFSWMNGNTFRACLNKGETLYTQVSQNSGATNRELNYGETFTYIQITEDPTARLLAGKFNGLTTKCQTKTLSGAISTTGIMTDLTFSNLTTGNKYRAYVDLTYSTSTGAVTNKQILIEMDRGGVFYKALDTRVYGIGDWIFPYKDTIDFDATATSITFDVVAISANESIVSSSSIRLCELPSDYYEETTQW